MPAKIWEMYQEPAYAVAGSPVSVFIAIKNDSPTSQTIWVTARFDSTTCIDHAAIGIPGGMVFKWWTCQCGNFMPPQVTVHIEAGHGGGDTPDDVYDFVIRPGAVLDCGHGGPYTGNPGVPVQFNSFAQGGIAPYTFNWDFGDGIGTSTEQNPTYTYPQRGQYDVKLTVYDVTGRNIFKYTTATIGTPPVSYNLTMTINPDGWGEVPPFGFHGDTISFPENTVVTLEAFRIVTSRFDRWSGDLESTVNPVDVLMDGDKTIVANFVPWGDVTRCWRCEGTEPVYHDFPAGLICGQGDAAEWPYSSEPDCSQPPPTGQPPWLIIGLIAAGIVATILIIKKR